MKRQQSQPLDDQPAIMALRHDGHSAPARSRSMCFGILPVAVFCSSVKITVTAHVSASLLACFFLHKPENAKDGLSFPRNRIQFQK